MYELELEYAKGAAIKAGEMLLHQSEAVVDSMEGKDIKLAMDKASEALLIRCLAATGYPILSEEQEAKSDTQKYLKKGKL